MTYIGYIYEYNYTTVTIVDVNRNLHQFHRDPSFKIEKDYMFVTFELDKNKVINVIPLESYPTFNNWSEIGDEKYYITYWGKDCGITDRNGDYRTLNSKEEFIVSKLCHKEPLLPNGLPAIIEPEYHKDIKSILANVDYVSSHLREIASSYKIKTECWTYSRPGGDDHTGVKVDVELSYRDVYVDTFFLKSDSWHDFTIESEKLGWIYSKVAVESREIRDGDKFMLNYNREEHLIALLYEKYMKDYKSNYWKIVDNERFAAYWGIALGFYGYEGNRFSHLTPLVELTSVYKY